MYTLLKSITKKIIPKKFLIENEEFIRKFLIPLYSGNKHECTICDTKLNHFAKLENGDLLCPVCGSLARTRRLFKLLEKDFLKPNMALLDFSPSRSLYRKMKAKLEISYYSTDFENEFLSDYHFDITKIDCADETFDLITCYHILEHIPNDIVAMKELYRVLKKNGVVLIQTPFKEGEIYEDEKIITSEDRLKHFGQEDHVRIYSALGLQKRLEEAGFSAEIKIFEYDEYFGFTKSEKVIVCKKI